jgi:hypothetical protein
MLIVDPYYKQTINVEAEKEAWKPLGGRGHASVIAAVEGEAKPA